MGVIKRQGFKRSVVSYAGVALGLASTLFIYPLELEIYGTAQFFISLAVLIAPLATLGIRTLAIRFFPDFRDDESGHHGLLGLLILSSLLVFAAFSALLLLFRPYFYHLLQQLHFDKMVFAENLMIIGLLTFAYVFMDLFSTYASNFQRVAVPELLSNFSLKVGLPILILLVYFNWWTQAQFDWGLVGLYGLMALSLAIYLRQLGQWRLRIDWSFLTPPRRHSMLSYAFFGMLTALGGTLAFRIDSIMVTSLIDERTNGAYNIALFMTNTIIIPFQAINAIAGPIVADNWASKDLGNILDIYRRSSLNLLLIGGFLFALLYLVLDDLLRISTNYEELVIIKDIVFLLGLAKVIDMTTGINNIIIGYSSAYRFNFYSILLLGVMNVLMNYLLIPRYHIVGAALATLVSLLAYNLAKYLFILFRFGMQPFTWGTLKVLALGLGAYALLNWLPRTGWPLVNLALLGGLFTLLFWIPALYWRLSPDINETVERVWRRLRHGPDEPS